jgi:multiple sugar transport system substrate-binding protein
VRSALPALLLAVVLVVTAACTPDGQAPPARQSSSAPPGPVALSLSVFGSSTVLRAYQEIAADYSVRHPAVRVAVHPFADEDDELRDVRARTARDAAPDLFLVDLDSLPAVLGRAWPGAMGGPRPLNQPVDELLGQRHLDFGDGYSRVGLEAFSANSRLQCMPVDLSPMVVYYNTDLIRIGRLARPGDDPVTREEGWTLEDFARAVRMAARGGNDGVAIAPDLGQVAPFVWSGGGDVVDDEQQPTTTELSGGASTNALQQLLQIVRNPRVAVTPEQLRRQSAVQRFRAGHLGMLLGFRALIPQLRTAQGLHFDVMPMPYLRQPATLGSVRALCLARGSRNVEAAADLLAHLVSDRAARALAATGSVMPSNLDAVNSAAFLQPGRQPQHARVFDTAVRDIEFLPGGRRWRQARAVVDQALVTLWTRPVIDPLDERLEAVDRRTATILTPPPAPDEPSSPAQSSPAQSSPAGG